MKVVIAGAGKVGRSLTKQLSNEGYDVTLIDQKANVLQNCIDRYDIMAVQGNCATMSVLTKAGIQDADVLVALTNADEVNLLCCATAKELNKTIHTIARIRNPEYADQIYKMRDVFGLSMAINPEKQTAREIDRLLKYPGFLKRDTFAKGRVEIVELRLSHDSVLTNVKLNDLNNIIKCKILVCVVVRGDEVFVPNGDFELKVHDRIFVTAPADNLTILLKNLGILNRKIKHMILCGGGMISFYLAKLLEKQRIDVKIIEQNPARCEELASMLDETTIIEGDVGNQFTLVNEQIESSDAVVALTGLDELNIVISMFSHNIGVPQTITKLSHDEHGSILSGVALGGIVSPKELCCNRIVQYIRALQNQSGAAITVSSLIDGQAEATEFIVDSTVRNCGVELKKLRIRKGILVACINHDNNIEIANGDSKFVEGDHVIVVSTGKRIVYTMNEIFE
ncbi:MAG: Trk system potassium transporter TrkA [Eubacteriales bacterium]|nr:Trk system potassium transporter TrkA [Eubacteriales bacterium]